MKNLAVGVDLGTTNSVVAVSRSGQHQVIAADGKHRIHPSMVAFLKDGRILVGRRAKAVQQRLPERTIYNTKRLIGRFFGSEEVERVRTLVPFEMLEGPRGDVHVAIGDRAYSVIDIASIILNFLKKTAENTLRADVKQAVITVPAHFNDNQRHATQSAARIAGLEPIRILNEPTAAAIAFGLGQEINKRIAVYDFGGGTFDISILDISKDIFEVAATSGDTFLGGADIDRLIAQDFVQHVNHRYGIEVESIPGFVHNLLPVAEQVKILLSDNNEVVFNLEGIQVEGKSVDLQMELTQKRLGEIAAGLIQRSFLVCDEALQMAGIRAKDIDEVVLTGGQTMMPVVRQAVANYFQRQPLGGVHPLEAVSIGAAILAEQLTQPQRPAVGSFFAGSGKRGRPDSLGPAADDEVELELELVEDVSVPPIPRALLLDVTPMTLRLATTDGFTTPIVDRNTTIPLEKTKMFYTARENQDSVSIRIYQGEAAKESANQRLGSFSFSGLQPGDDGRGLVEVTFTVNADGILTISARDAISGARRVARIDYTNRIPDEEIEARLEAPEDLDRIQI